MFLEGEVICIILLVILLFSYYNCRKYSEEITTTIPTTKETFLSAGESAGIAFGSIFGAAGLVYFLLWWIG
jgi:hypothetical protein